VFKAGIIAAIGQPNVGKSTLINAIVGQKVSIVSSKPQTTRRRAIGIYQSEVGQIVFVDTPGIHEPHTRLGKVMVDQARGSLDNIDAILVVVDAARLPNELDRQIAKLALNAAKAEREIPIVLCLNKMDLLKAEFVVENTEAFCKLFATEKWMLTTATQGRNLDKLVELLLEVLPEGDQLFPTDEFTDQSTRFMVAEIIREKVLLSTKQEVPHSTAVRIESWGPNSKGDLEISAAIVVEKTSQRAILIGKGGQFIKQLGIDSRKEIEDLVQEHVYLELHILVREEWRQSLRMLRELEYSE
jgi:GTP-binding protein Era